MVPYLYISYKLIMLTTGSDQAGRHRDRGADVQEQGGAGELVFTLCLIF